MGATVPGQPPRKSIGSTAALLSPASVSDNQVTAPTRVESPVWHLTPSMSGVDPSTSDYSGRVSLRSGPVDVWRPLDREPLAEGESPTGFLQPSRVRPSRFLLGKKDERIPEPRVVGSRSALKWDGAGARLWHDEHRGGKGGEMGIKALTIIVYPEEASSLREAIEIATTIAEQEGWEGEPASFEETEGEPGWAIRWEAEW